MLTTCSRSAWLAWSLFAIALVPRLAIVWWSGFDGLYGQDAFAYISYAEQLRRGDPHGPFYWPLGYPALATAVSWLVPDVVRAAQIVSLATGAAVAPLTFLLTDRLPSSSRTVAFVAGLIVAVSGQLLQVSLLGMSDAAALCFTTLSAVLLVAYGRAAEVRPATDWRLVGRVAGASAAYTAALLCRLLCGVVALPWLLYWLAVTPSRSRFSVRWLVPIAVPVIIVFLHVIVTLNAAPRDITDHWVRRWSPANAVRTTFDLHEGPARYSVPPALFYTAPAAHPYYMVPVLGIFGAVGLWRLRRTREFRLVGGWIAVTYGFLAGIPYENLRYGLVFFPPVAVAASIGLLAPARQRAWRIAVVAACLAAGAPFTVRGIDALLDVKQRETAVLQAVRTAVPTGSPLVTFGISAMLEQYTDYAVHDLYLTSQRELDAVRCGTAPAFAIVDERTLDAQWKGLPPARHFDHLRDAGVSPVTHAGKWTLFTISSAGCPPTR